MKKNVCLLFELSYTPTLREFSFFDIGKGHEYFIQSKEDFLGKYDGHYNIVLEKLTELVTSEKIPCALRISGSFIKMLELHEDDGLQKLKALVANEQVSLVGTTYSNSLASLYSVTTFKKQIEKQQSCLTKHFGTESQKIFQNGLNIYSNKIAEIISQMGYQTMVANHVEWYSNRKTPFQVYQSKSQKPINILLSNGLNSNDTANSQVFVHEVGTAHQDVIQKLDALSSQGANDAVRFMSIDEAQTTFESENYYDVSAPIGGYDIAPDLSHFMENTMQKEALSTFFGLESKVLNSRNESVIDDWLALDNAENYLKMSLRHKVDRPYDHYISFMNVLADIEVRLKSH